VRQLDAAVDAYLGARLDTRVRLDSVLSADPECVIARCFDGYLHMLSSNGEGHQRALAALDATRATQAANMTRREALHVAALDAWSHGDMRAAADQWDALLADSPRDIMAIKASQFVLSYLGEADRMRETVERVLPSWDAGMPGYGFVLGCYAYGLEESGEYARAEAMGRRAVELNPADIWAAHAVAHVSEMEGRLHDGIEWIAATSGHWQECNNFAYHLRWHEALYHHELGQNARVLELYDREVRRQSTDESLDLTNAVSLLWRLEQAGADVGPRWRELAVVAHRHVGDHALVFVDLHYLIALAAANDSAGVESFMESCRRFAATERSTEAAVMARVGLPLAQAVLAHRQGDYGEVVDLLYPVHQHFSQIGGSRAQRDLFYQLLIDAAWRGRRLDAAAELLTERLARRPRNLWGWRHYTAVLDALGAPGAYAAHRELERLAGA
jgi:tetratricopeptide (TPR) repeat protein